MNKQEFYRLLHSNSSQFNVFLKENNKGRENNILFLESNSNKKVFEKYNTEFLNEVNDEISFIFKDKTLYSSSFGNETNLYANDIEITNIDFSLNINSPVSKELIYTNYFYKINPVDEKNPSSIITKIESSSINNLNNNTLSFYKIEKDDSSEGVNKNTNFEIAKLNLENSSLSVNEGSLVFTKTEKTSIDLLNITLENDVFEDVLYDETFKAENDRVRIVKSGGEYYIECIGNALRELTTHKRFLLFGDPNIPLQIIETKDPLENGIKFSYDNNIKKIFITCNGLYEYNSFSESTFKPEPEEVE